MERKGLAGCEEFHFVLSRLAEERDNGQQTAEPRRVRINPAARKLQKTFVIA